MQSRIGWTAATLLLTIVAVSTWSEGRANESAGLKVYNTHDRLSSGMFSDEP